MGYFCASLKINIVNGVLKDISRMTEHKQLCHNENCTEFFNEKIENKKEILNNTLFTDEYCVRFGLQEKAK